MGKFYDEIPDTLKPWIEKQKMFWVATAPLSAEGHVNLSPKGYEDTFFVLGPRRVWYEDLTGSGAETISHLRENGRITIMFCAFDGPPRILRIFGTGTAHEYGTPEYNALIPPEKRKPGSRSAIVVDVHRVGTSCGYGVPLYTFHAHRTTLFDWNEKLEKADQESAAGSLATGVKTLRGYWAQNNLKSIDGLTGMLSGHISDVPPQSQMRHKEIRNVVKRTVSDWRECYGLGAAFVFGVVAATTFMRLGPPTGLSFE